MTNEITSGFKLNYTAKEQAIKQLLEEEKEKKSLAKYSEVLNELNIMEFR